jgi:hypothetical protein
VDALSSFVSANVGAVALLLAAVCVVLGVAVAWLVRRASALDRRLDGLTRGTDGRDLGAVLDTHVEKIYAVAGEVNALTSRAAVIEATQRKAIQRTGLVRYNPFEDTGGNQSFAVALLDAHGDGVVISSLHARSATRIYAKAIAAGRSEAALSDEESEALRLAMAPDPATARPA